MVGFFRVGDERLVPDKDRTVIAVAVGGTSIAPLLVSQDRVSGLLLDFQNATRGWISDAKVDAADPVLDI